MKKIFKTLPLALIVMSIYSCTSDDETVQDVNDNSSVVTTFTCTQENDGTATKAALGSEGNILWEAEDAISIFDGNKENHQYSLDLESVGKTTGIFSGTGAVTGPYVAVYPHNSNATLNNDGTVSNIVLPDEQNAVDDGFDPNAALMIAKSTTTSLQFRNAVGFIKVQLAEGFDCKKIILRAADKTTPLAGKGTIKFDSSGNPYIDFTGSTELTYSITLSGDITGGNAYYIAVPAGEYSANWTLTFVTENENYMRQVAKSITFKRSKALNLGEFAIGGDYWVTGSSGIVDPSQEVDMGVFKIGGTNYRLIFAKSNLTATGLAANEYDFGDYFAWGATEPWLTSYTYDGSVTTDDIFIYKTWKDDKLDGYIKNNAPFYDGSTYTQYKSMGNTLEAAHDAANMILGGDWQLPTKGIWEKLVNANNTTVYWGPEGNMSLEEINGIKGIKITRNDESGSSIFLPAAGSVYETEISEVGIKGYYWSNTLYSILEASRLIFNEGFIYAQNRNHRYFGFSVRPVRLVAE